MRDTKHQGTRVVIYNLAQDPAGNYELDFNQDTTDIRLPPNYVDSETRHIDKTENAVSEYRVSLTKYVSILYFRPTMQVFIRGNMVERLCLTKHLVKKKMATYTPKTIRGVDKKPIKIQFGQTVNKEDQYGIVMYHHNRLIQAFRKINIRKNDFDGTVDPNKIRELMEQVMCVVEVNCLQPNHVKQAFTENSQYRNIEATLNTRLWSYCLDMYDDFMQTNPDDFSRQRDLWVQCDEPECQKWRRLPYGTRRDTLPARWVCMNNPDVLYNTCEADEEPEKDPEYQAYTSKRGRPKKNGSNSAQETPVASTSAAGPSSAAASVSGLPSSRAAPNQTPNDYPSNERPASPTPSFRNWMRENVPIPLGKKRTAPAITAKPGPSTSADKRPRRLFNNQATPDGVQIIPVGEQEPEVIVLEDDGDDGPTVNNVVPVKQEPANDSIHDLPTQPGPSRLNGSVKTEPGIPRINLSISSSASSLSGAASRYTTPHTPAPLLGDTPRETQLLRQEVGQLKVRNGELEKDNKDLREQVARLEGETLKLEEQVRGVEHLQITKGKLEEKLEGMQQLQAENRELRARVSELETPDVIEIETEAEYQMEKMKNLMIQFIRTLDRGYAYTNLNQLQKDFASINVTKSPT